jgi:hypothetical protein
MLSAKKALSTAAIAILMATGALIATAGTASARVVCGADGDCWHTDAAPPRVPGVTFSVHPDDWYFHQTWTGSDRHFRDYHEGRGYYKGGVWVTL